jgi:hypothetical protein
LTVSGLAELSGELAKKADSKFHITTGRKSVRFVGHNVMAAIDFWHILLGYGRQQAALLRGQLRRCEMAQHGVAEPQTTRLVRAGLALPSFHTTDKRQGQGKPSPYETTKETAEKVFLRICC